MSLISLSVCSLIAFWLSFVAQAARPRPTVRPDGAVYAMSNNFERNTVVAYTRNANGTLTILGEFATGGSGGQLNVGPSVDPLESGAAVDPLKSQFSLIITSDKRFVLVCNAGSSSVSVLRILSDFSLRLVSVSKVRGFGPISITEFENTVYVGVADTDGTFTTILDQEGLLVGFKLVAGRLLSIPGSIRRVPNRPTTVQFSPDGRFLVYTAFNAGSVDLPSGSEAEVSVFGVNRLGKLSTSPLDTATSTFRGNTEGRNLPAPIGFVVVQSGAVRYVVVTETRVFLSDGSLAAPQEIQTSSISTWMIADDGSLVPVSQDVLTGESITVGSQTACWLTFSADGDNFWAVNTADSAISSFSFNSGSVVLVATEEAISSGDGFIDLCTSPDGKFLYQHEGLAGMISSYEIADGGAGTGLTFIDSDGGLPPNLTQGLACI